MGDSQQGVVAALKRWWHRWRYRRYVKPLTAEQIGDFIRTRAPEIARNIEQNNALYRRMVRTQRGVSAPASIPAAFERTKR